MLPFRLGLLFASLCAAQNLAPPATGKAQSQWVFYTAPGTLSYKPLPSSDRVLDFSTAGYGGGGVPLPIVPPALTVTPSGGDDTAPIQNAIDRVSQLPLRNGVRGGVLLTAGTFQLSGQLNINASGVVLAGSGSGPGATLVEMTGDPHLFLSIAGTGSPQTTGSVVTVTDTYVPAGATSFNVTDASSFSPGQQVMVARPVTPAWIHFMGMDRLVRNGQPENWISAGSHTRTPRTIQSIAGNQVTLDAPLSDNIDSAYLNPPGALLYAYAFPGRISQSGVEHLQVIAPAAAVPFGSAVNQLITMDAIIDGWVDDVAAADVVNAVTLGGASKQITVANVRLTHTAVNPGSALFSDFTITGTQGLLDHVSSTGNHLFYVATESGPDGAQGPNVVVDSNFVGDGSIQPHQRWSTGLLVDNCVVNGGSIEYIDRGYDGTGHGWTMGSGVVWNSSAQTFTIQTPPGSENFCIGCHGATMVMQEPGSSFVPPDGFYEWQNAFVTPLSLYRAQLAQRLRQPPPAIEK